MNSAPDLALPVTQGASRAARPNLGNALSAELLKLRRQRSTWVFSCLGVLALALVAAGGVDLPERPPGTPASSPS